VDSGLCELPADLFGTVPDDNMDIRPCKLMGGIQDMLQQRFATDAVKYLGQAGAHACSLAGRQNDDAQ
jgi:hypothetical protein